MALMRRQIGGLLDWCRRLNWVKNVDEKCVFITGCDSGFGYALAKSLSGYGITVYGGCYTESAGNRLRQEAGSNFRPIRVDVTNSSSVRNAAEYVKETLPHGKKLWGVVNNAGILGATLPTEMLNKDDFRKVYEVNVFGMVDVTNAFLPLLKRSKGRIVNMASIGAIVPFPNWTPYISSKHAAKGYSDSLRLEKHAWDIKVSTIQPGFMMTDLFNVMDDAVKVKWETVPASLRAEYGEDYVERSQLWTHKLLHKEASKQLYKVIHAYEDALFSKRPRAVYYPGWSAKYLLAIQTLPSVIWDQYLLRQLSVFPKAVEK